MTEQEKPNVYRFPKINKDSRLQRKHPINLGLGYTIELAFAGNGQLEAIIFPEDMPLSKMVQHFAAALKFAIDELAQEGK